MLLESMPEGGSRAPAFSALEQDGEKVSLAGLKGKKVALLFYPKDDTPTYTVEVCDLRDNHARLKKAGYNVIGVSPDDITSHKKFANKFKLPFSLLADEEKKIVNAYGVWGPKKLYGREYDGLHRTTFLINEKGIIERLITGVRSKIHAQQILKDG